MPEFESVPRVLVILKPRVLTCEARARAERTPSKGSRMGISRGWFCPLSAGTTLARNAGVINLRFFESLQHAWPNAMRSFPQFRR